MDLFESKRCRRLLVHLDPGLELVDWLQRFTSLPSPRWAEVRIYGTARSVEFRSLLARGAQRLTGNIEVLELRGLCGPTAPPLRGQIVLDGKQLLTGEILRLDCQATLAAIDLYEELGAFADAVPDATAPPSNERSWSEVVAASTGASDDEDDGDEAPIKIGDFLEHPKFGRCKVERVEGNQEFITVRTPAHRAIRLSLEVLSLRAGGLEGKSRIWKAKLATAE